MDHQDYRDLGAYYARIAHDTKGTAHSMDYIQWMEFHKEYLESRHIHSDFKISDVIDQGFISELFTLRRV